MDEQVQPSKQQIANALDASKRLAGVLHAGLFPGEISREVSEARIFADAMIQDGEQRLKAFELKGSPAPEPFDRDKNGDTVWPDLKKGVEQGILREDAPNGES